MGSPFLSSIVRELLLVLKGRGENNYRFAPVEFMVGQPRKVFSGRQMSEPGGWDTDRGHQRRAEGSSHSK